jgi:hypothetical protein
MRRLLSAAVLSLLVAGCGHDRPTVRLATEGTVFDLGGSGTLPQATVPFTVTNRGEGTILLPSCGGRVEVSVEHGVADHWEQYSSAICGLADLQTPIELRAGQSVTSEYYFYQPGHFRMRLPWSSSAAKVFGDESSTSNPFDVR